MPRPSPSLSGLILLVGLVLLAGCGPSRPPLASPNANLALPPPGGPGGGGRVAAPQAYRPVAPAAPAARPIPETPIGEGRLNSPAALAAACRENADRVLVQRDRSELMREDERDSRLGTFESPYAFRAPSDRLGRQFERDRMARDCIQRNSRGTPDR